MPVMSGKRAFLDLLKQEGVDIMFGNPGTTELAIMEALSRQSQIEYVLGLQESIVVAMADGYARASGRLAACNVHVAPGLGNAMGSLYNAKFYGSPVLLTAGQQEQGHGLMEPLLYDPLVPMKVNAGLEEYLRKHRFASIADLVGGIDPAKSVNQAASG